MSSERIDVTLRGGTAEEFRDLRRRVERRCGHSVTRARVVSILLASVDPDDLPGSPPDDPDDDRIRG